MNFIIIQGLVQFSILGCFAKQLWDNDNIIKTIKLPFNLFHQDIRFIAESLKNHPERGRKETCISFGKGTILTVEEDIAPDRLALTVQLANAVGEPTLGHLVYLKSNSTYWNGDGEGKINTTDAVPRYLKLNSLPSSTPCMVQYASFVGFNTFVAKMHRLLPMWLSLQNWTKLYFVFQGVGEIPVARSTDNNFIFQNLELLVADHTRKLRVADKILFKEVVFNGQSFSTGTSDEDWPNDNVLAVRVQLVEQDRYPKYRFASEESVAITVLDDLYTRGEWIATE